MQTAVTTQNLFPKTILAILVILSLCGIAIIAWVFLGSVSNTVSIGIKSVIILSLMVIALVNCIFFFKTYQKQKEIFTTISNIVQEEEPEQSPCHEEKMTKESETLKIDEKITESVPTDEINAVEDALEIPDAIDESDIADALEMVKEETIVDEELPPASEDIDSEETEEELPPQPPKKYKEERE